MHLGEPANKKTKTRIRAVAAVLGLSFFIAFFREILDVGRQIFGAFLFLVLRFPLGAGEAVPNSSNIILFNCLVGFGLVFVFWLFLISAQALLPVRGFRDIYRTTYHLWLYIIHRHGPAFHIKDGQAIATKEELDRHGPGVIVVDFNSAVVLEEREDAPGLSRVSSRSWLKLLNLLELNDALQPTRVCGPGIVFTLPHERMRGEPVDLRRQFRMQPKIHCYTREGIELYSNIVSIFTIGQDPEPDALQVAYIGERRPENLRVITLEKAQGGSGNYMRVTGIADELDLADQREIHHYARVLGHTPGALQPYQDLAQNPAVPIFNPNRVFAAVSAQARAGDEEMLPWSALPTRVGAGLYREILPTINYDELYDIKGNGRFPLPSFKRRLMVALRNNGLLAYRLLQLRSNKDLTQGTVYPTRELLISPVQQLTNSKLLRDRGIKIGMGSFSDPNPTSSIIYKQRLDTWRARWEKELDITNASRELRAMKIHGKAMAAAQHDLWYSLSQIFSINENNDEALAIYIMQALESAAADPKTRELLPGNTLDFMKHIQNLLSPPPPAPVLPPPPPPDQGNQFTPIHPGGPD